MRHDPQVDSHARPPRDELPGVVPFDVVVGRATDTVVVLGAIRAYSCGLMGHLYVHSRADAPVDPLRSLLGRRANRPGDEISDDEILLLGVEYSDGRTGRSDDPNGEVLVGVGGGHGGGGRGLAYWDGSIWITPLPVEGPVVISCRWLARGVDERVTIDGSALLDGARSVEPLWRE